MPVLYLILIAIFALINLKKGSVLLKYCLFYKKGYLALKQSVLSYGYNYDLKQHLIMITLTIISLSIVCYQFEVCIESFLLLLFFSSLILPTLFLWIIFNSYQEKQFNDFTMFLQNFIAMFKINPKTYAILNECVKICEGEVKSIIQQSIDRLGNDGNITAAFQPLLEYYPHFIVHNLISLVTTIEMHGGEQFLDGLDLIQDDIDDWIEDTYAFKKAQIQAKNRMISLCILSSIIAIFAKNMLKEIDFNTESVVYQAAILCFFLTLLITLLMAHKTISESWIEKEECIWPKH